MRIIRLICGLALPVSLVFGGISVASAQGEDATQACTPDAMRLCGEFIPDRDKVRICMMHKRSQWSEACRVAIGGGRHEREHRVYRHPRHYRHHHE
jgi:hypothetical protein